MPTYEYRCPNGHDFDHFFRKISDGEAIWPCPVCGLPAERQMSGGAGLVFKGSGFYITDYGKDGKKDQRTAGTSDGVKPAAAPASGSDGAAAPAKSGESGGSGGPAPTPAPAPGGEGRKPAAEAKKSGKPQSE